MQIKISIDTVAGDDLFGKSKWWGSPDLPQDMDYPCYTDDTGEEWPLTFVCQINCADLQDYAAPLPKEGLLCFFARLDYYLGYDDVGVSGEGVWPSQDAKVIYIPPEEMEILQQKILVDDDDNPLVLPPRKIKFVVSSKNTSGSGGHKLLGKPDLMPWADWDAPCEGWQLLLQVDSDEAEDFVLRFMDEGIMYFLIHPSDLAQSNFSDVRAAMVSM